jgi:hypothetical protein
MTPESYHDLVDHIIRETGLPEAKADDAAAAMGDRPETDAEGQLVIRSGEQTFHINPWPPDGE